MNGTWCVFRFRITVLVFRFKHNKFITYIHVVVINNQDLIIHVFLKGQSDGRIQYDVFLQKSHFFYFFVNSCSHGDSRCKNTGCCGFIFHFRKIDHKTRIFLFRHGERCDRSDNLCLSDADGITLLGAEQAVNNGEMFNARVSDYEVYSTDTTRTVQTAKYFSGKAVTVLPELSVCDVTIFDTLKKLAAKNKNTVIFTHNHCLSFIASYMKNWKFEPEYLDGLVMSEENGDLILDGELDLKE
ncbi:TPA: lipopolysaccharide core heptose(II)-phosphate phosphatase [Escherichia coli]|nr:lipopolysaccharide core heptose(II)-phosphate phosphatase [Escherichia coli]HAN8173979.1 lipopolysaccharide core heptose(II)-phosphate phosphatase [Escherichia coli]